MLGNLLQDIKIRVTLRAALRIKPDFAEAHCALGNVRWRPGYACPRFGLGKVLGSRGDWEKAVAELQKAVRLDPDWAEASK